MNTQNVPSGGSRSPVVPSDEPESLPGVTVVSAPEVSAVPGVAAEDSLLVSAVVVSGALVVELPSPSVCSESPHASPPRLDAAHAHAHHLVLALALMVANSTPRLARRPCVRPRAPRGPGAGARDVA